MFLSIKFDYIINILKFNRIASLKLSFFYILNIKFNKKVNL